MSPPPVGLPEALERAASALSDDAADIRPANGDPIQLIELLEPDAATRVLEWLLAEEPDAGAELALSWAEIPDRASNVLLAVTETGLPKPAKKAIRRALHRMRSAGVEIPQESTSTVVARLPSVEEKLDEALVSPLDPTGTRMAYLVEAHPSGGARLFEVMLSEDRGVLEFEVYNASRGKVRRFLRDFTRRERFPGISAPPASVRALVDRTASRESPERPTPRGFDEWRSHFADPGGALTPGGLVRDALVAADDVDAAEQRIIEQIRERELGPWPPQPEVLQSIAGKLEELTKGSIIVSGAQKREQAEEILEQSVIEAFVGPFSEFTALRFEENAYILWKNDNEADARACLAVADLFQSGPERARKVARAMLDVLLGPLVERVAEGEPTGESEPEDESLIVKP